MNEEIAIDQEPEGAFPQPKRQQLAEAIADSIAEAIATRHLKSHERIIETAFAARYNVSRVPVREALKILHTQGILTGGGHRGYRVASFSSTKAIHVSEVRRMLETFLLRDAIINWRTGKADISDLEARMTSMRQACEIGSFREVLRADLDFHREISKASMNEVAATLWETIARHVLIIFNIARYRDIELDVVVKRHEKLLAFIKKQIKNPDSTEVLSKTLEKHFMSRRIAKKSRQK